MILTTQHFKSDYRIAVTLGTGGNSAKIDEIIADREPEILRDLLGSALCTELKNSTLGGGATTPSPELTYIFNEFDYVNGCIDIHSDGIIKMLAQMIYFYIAREGIAPNTPLGNRNNTAEVSDRQDNTNLVLVYNRGKKSYDAIQAYIKLNSVSYPTFKGKYKQFASLV